MGPDGALYGIDYSGGPWFASDGGTKIYRIEYRGTCSPAEPKLPTPIGLQNTRSHELLPQLGFGHTITVPASVQGVQAIEVSGRIAWAWDRNGMSGDTQVEVPGDLQSNLLRLRYIR